MVDCFDATSGTSQADAQLMPPPPKVSRPIRLRLASDAIPITMKLVGRCRICLNLDLKYEYDKMATMHFAISFEKLREGSEMGCIYCTIICITKRIYAQEMPDEVNEVCVHTDHMNPDSTRFCLRWPQSGRKVAVGRFHDDRDIKLQMSLCPQARPWERFQRWQSIPASAKSSETVSFCRDRLRECLTTQKNASVGMNGFLLAFYSSETD
jgi:hypothetical protein